MRRSSAASLLASDWCSPLNSFWAEAMWRRKNLCVASASSRLTRPFSIMMALQRNVPRAWDKHSRRFKISARIFWLMSATLLGKVVGLSAVLFVSFSAGATDVATASSCSRCKISTCNSRISAFAKDTTLLITGVDGRSTVEYTGSLSMANGEGRVAGGAAADCGLVGDTAAAGTLALGLIDSAWRLSNRRRDVRLPLDESVDDASIDNERPRRGRRRLGVKGIRSALFPSSVAARGRKTTVRLRTRTPVCRRSAVTGGVALVATTVWDQASCHQAETFHVLYASSSQAEQLPEKNGSLYGDEEVVGRIAWVLAVSRLSWCFWCVPLSFLCRPAAWALHRLFSVERVSNAVQVKAVPARQDSDRARKFLLERSYICEGIHLDGIKTHRAFNCPSPLHIGHRWPGTWCRWRCS